MTIDYKALAAEVREMRLGHKVFGGTLEILETLLEGMAEEKPAAWMALAYGLPSQATTDEPTAIRWRKAGGDVVPLYAHPAPAAPQAEPKRAVTCLWSRADEDTDTWETACRHAFTIIEGGPTDNQMTFCCYCGRPLEQEIGGSDAE